MTVCYMGMGGNISNEQGTPRQHIQRAIDAFCASTNFWDVRVSPWYRSKAYGVTDQPDFINLVLCAKTTLSPLALLDFCQALENQAGRVRLRHWGERCLDVDILLYGDQVIQNDRLTVPHPELLVRNFVLVPLLQLTPDLVVRGQKLQELPAANDHTHLYML